jgi:hypothetical protein
MFTKRLNINIIEAISGWPTYYLTPQGGFGMTVFLFRKTDLKAGTGRIKKIKNQTANIKIKESAFGGWIFIRSGTLRLRWRNVPVPVFPRL